MNQRREGTFLILYKYHDNYLDEHQEIIRGIKEEGFTVVKTIEGNKFSTPFQDIWLAPDRIHQVHFVYDPIVNTNYLRIRGEDDGDLVGQIIGWFSSFDETELSTIVLEALEENDVDEKVQAIFNFAIGFYVYDPRYLTAFEKYLKSPSVKVRLATIRAIGFQLWNECAPILENLIQNDSNSAVKAYATETLRQIQQPDFDPDDLYENPSNYPNSLERVTEKGLMILPQIKDDLQAWMKEQDYLVMDALILYQYLVETYGEFKPTDEPIDENQNAESLTNTEDDLEQSTETPEPQQPEITEYEQLQQHLKQDKKQLKQLRSQLKQVEARIEDARRTNIFGRPQSGDNEREQEQLTQEIKETKQRINQNEALLKAEEEQINEN